MFLCMTLRQYLLDKCLIDCLTIIQAEWRVDEILEKMSYIINIIQSQTCKFFFIIYVFYFLSQLNNKVKAKMK